MSIVQNRPWLPDKWDYEEDVVIIGYGGAGVCAAIAIHDAGVKALVLEKAPVGGGNASTAGGGFAVPGDVGKGIEYYRALTWGKVDEELIRVLAESTHGVPRWMEKLGAKPKLVKHRAQYPSLPGADSFQTMSLPRTPREIEQGIRRGPGAQLWHFFDNQVERRKTHILYETPAKGLIQDPLTREILGVKATNSAKKEICVKAKKGIILACGGFQNNMEMIREFLPFAVELPIYPWGTPYNTGDGILMATEVGAKLWHMTSVEYGAFAPKAPSEKFGVGFRFWKYLPAGSAAIYVNKYGKRFMDEGRLLSHCKELFKVQYFDAERAEYPGGKEVEIVHERRYKKTDHRVFG